MKTKTINLKLHTYDLEATYHTACGYKHDGKEMTLLVSDELYLPHLLISNILSITGNKILRIEEHQSDCSKDDFKCDIYFFTDIPWNDFMNRDNSDAPTTKLFAGINEDSWLK